MKILIIGADRLGDIPIQLRARGVTEIIHWSGRSKAQRKWVIPDNLTEAIIFYDFIAHNLMLQVKKELKQRSVPITFAKRGMSCLAALKLNGSGLCKEAI